MHSILTEGRTEAVGEDPAHDTGSPARFINELSRRLVAAGVPLWHTTVYAATLHPQIRGFGWHWWRDGRLTEEVRIAQGTELTKEFLRVRCAARLSKESYFDGGLTA